MKARYLAIRMRIAVEQIIKLSPSDVIPPCDVKKIAFLWLTMDPRHGRGLGRKEHEDGVTTASKSYREVDPSDTNKRFASAIKFPRLRPIQKILHFLCSFR